MAALNQKKHTISEGVVADFYFSVILSASRQEGEKEHVKE